MQLGHSTADGALRHSSGEHPQSAQRIAVLSFAGMAGKHNFVSYTESLHLIGKVGSVRHHRGWFALWSSAFRTDMTKA